MKKSHIAGIVVIALAIGAIISTIKDAGTYVNFARARSHPDKEYTVIGKLNKSKEIFYDPEIDANSFSFFAIDNDGEEQKVVFNGTKPQDFERSEQITLQGRMGNEVFLCTKILMKCPSKYNDGKEQVEVKAEES